MLVSYPKTTGASALDKAAAAAKAGLAQVGVLDSSRFASLQPGYFVVFTGIYGSQTDADTAVPTVRAAGFAGRVLAADRTLSSHDVSPPQRVPNAARGHRFPRLKTFVTAPGTV